MVMAEISINLTEIAAVVDPFYPRTFSNAVLKFLKTKPESGNIDLSNLSDARLHFAQF